MENIKFLCHIVGLSPVHKKKLKDDYKYKKYHIIDLDKINQEIFNDVEIKKMFKQYQHFKSNKNDKYKDVDKKMTNFWEKNMINMIENNVLSKKKTIVIGNNSHFRNLSKKIQIPTYNRFFIEIEKNDVKQLIKFNLEKYKKNIINGSYPLNNIDYDYLIKTKIKLQDSYKNNGYILKSFNDIEKILELLLQRDDNIQGLWVSLNEPYNVSSRIHPKKNDKLFAYTEPIHALLGSFSWDSSCVEKISKGKEIKLIEKKDDALDLLKEKRFLYLVDPDTFIPHEKGNNIRYFSQVPTMIMEKEKISNVYKKLKDIGILNK